MRSEAILQGDTMHLIYELNQIIPIDRQKIMKALDNDTFITSHFNMLKKIEYLTEDKRAKGTKFKVSLQLKRKIFRFKSEINEYDAPESFSITTFTRHGNIITKLNLLDHHEGSHIQMNSVIDNTQKSTRIILKIMQPVIKITLDRSIYNFILEIQKDSVSNV